MSSKNKPADWFGLSLDLWMLGVECSSVIALRTWKMAAGGSAANDEAGRMVSEKIASAMALSQQAMMGQLGTSMPGIASKAVADYRRKVQANQKRLIKG